MPHLSKFMISLTSLLIGSCATIHDKDLTTWNFSSQNSYLIWVHGTQSHPEYYKIFALSNPDIKMILYNRYDSSLYWKHQIQRLDQLISRLQKGRKIILAGHSYGGTLALAYALTYPEKIKELVIIAAPLQQQYRPSWHTPLIYMHPYIPRSPLHQVLYENKQLEHLWGYISALKRPLNIRIHCFFDENDPKVNFENISYLKKMSPEIGMLRTQHLGHMPHFRQTSLLRTLLGIKHLSI